MNNFQDYYENLVQARDEIDIKLNELEFLRVSKPVLDEVTIINKDNAESCLDQYHFIIDEMADLVGVLNSEIEKFELEDPEAAYYEEMKMDLEREDS